jgi:hypothetical protein
MRKGRGNPAFSVVRPSMGRILVGRKDVPPVAGASRDEPEAGGERELGIAHDRLRLAGRGDHGIAGKEGFPRHRSRATHL